MKRIIFIIQLFMFCVLSNAQIDSLYSQTIPFIGLPDSFAISSTRNPCYWGEPSYALQGCEIKYAIAIPDTMNILVHNLGTEIPLTGITVLTEDSVEINRSEPKNLYYIWLQSNNLWADTLSASHDCYILRNLPPAIYFLSVQGISNDGLAWVNGKTRTTIIGWKDINAPFPLKVFPTAEDEARYNQLGYGNDSIPNTNQPNASSPEEIDYSDKGVSAFNFISKRIYTSADVSTWLNEITFYDGLGREVETIKQACSPQGGDFISLQEYDNEGLVSRKWKTAIRQTSDSTYVQHEDFYSLAATTYSSDDNPFSKFEYESSPLLRLKSKTDAGEEWHMGEKGTDFSYALNTVNGNILSAYCYSSDNILSNNPSGNITITCHGRYNNGELAITQINDEDNRVHLDFTNQRGEKILERKILDENVILDTYYIYDSFGNLTAVLPPAAANEMHSSGTWNSAVDEVLQEYAYLYCYDKRCRLVSKKLPGCDWITYIYDESNQLLFSQDGMQREEDIWTLRLTDIFNREVITGIISQDLSSSLLSQLSSSTSPVYAKRTNVENALFGYEIYCEDTTLQSQLSSLIDYFSPLNIYYYDDYNFLGHNGVPDSLSVMRFINEQGYGNRWSCAKTRLTGSITNHLGIQTTTPTTISVFYYDAEGRIVQQHSTNHLGGYDHIFTSYDFVGNIISQKVTHTCPPLSQPLSFIQDYTYDSWGRPLTTTLSYDGEEAVTIENNTYDALGRLSQTTRNSQSGLTTQYAYNIRDWVTQIASPVFVENLHYNTSNNGSTPQWGGNISSEEWKAGDDFTLNKLRSYNFAYDGVDRLLSAAYFENAIPKGRYSTQYTYDQMGNILTLKRYGLTDDGGFGLLDDLSYDYSGNQLVKVTDSNIDEPTYVHAMHFTDGADEDVEYEYNANGSLTADLNKGITGITYNAIGLPEIIMWNINKSLSFAYAADGRKLRRTYFYWRNANLHGGGSHLMPPVRPTIRTTDYCGPFIYETSALQDTHLSKVLFDGGYITPKADGTGEYHFYVKDHLGNIRAVVSQNDSIEEINHYYPYGSLFGESTGLSNETQPYKYTGKELDRMHGLDLHDHGARWSDTNIGRWHKIDSLAEKYYDSTPYGLCGNNPIRLIDLDGNFPSLWGLLYKATALYLETKGTSNKTKQLGYAMQHPINAYKVGDYKEHSSNISTIAANFQINAARAAGLTAGNEGDQGNAFRHALWQGIITNQLGESTALRIGNAHEDNSNIDLNKRVFSNMKDADTTIDLLNNAIGRLIGISNKGADNQTMALKIAKEFFQNGLWTASRNENGTISIQKTKLTIQQYNAVIKEIKKKGNNGLNE